MTQGIYLISSKVSNKVYIGQSSNIEDRWKRHNRELLLQKHHSYKLQADYSRGIELEYNILLVENDFILRTELEVQYIQEFDAYYSGYNCTTGRAVTGLGYSSNNAKYTREQYIQIVNALAYTDKKQKDIAEELSVSLQVVTNISTQRKHSWIETEMPLEYELIRIKNTEVSRPRGSNPNIEKAFLDLVYTQDSKSDIATRYALTVKKIEHIIYGGAYRWLADKYEKEYKLLSKNRLNI